MIRFKLNQTCKHDFFLKNFFEIGTVVVPQDGIGMVSFYFFVVLVGKSWKIGDAV